MLARTLAPVVKRISKTFPALLLTGPRQVGKTTLLQMCAQKNRRYISLDDLNARRLAQQDPQLFVKTHAPPVVIDEIQYAPDLLSALKQQIDQSHQKPGQYWLTGSQKFNLMKGVHESLAGRVAVLDLLGFSNEELEGRNQRPPFLPTKSWLKKNAAQKTASPHKVYKKIWQGSFPKVLKLPPSERDIFFRSYVQTYIQRDVRDITGVSNSTVFYNFIVAVAARTAQLVNYNDLSRDVGVDAKTIKMWLSILQASGLVYLLPAWHRHPHARVVKSSKLYFLDTGLASYLCQWSDVKTLMAGAMSGPLLETWLISEVLKSYWHRGQEARFYYYRDMDQKEIDLIIETADAFYPIECKKTSAPSHHVARTFSRLNKVLNKKVAHGFVFCLLDEPTALSPHCTAAPLAWL